MTILRWAVYLAYGTVATCLGGILLYIGYQGLPVLRWTFLFDVPKGTPLGSEGGILPALMGTVYVGTLTTVVGGVVSLCLALYMTKLAPHPMVTTIGKRVLEVLSGIPSIVIGLFGYSLFIVEWQWARGLWAAAVTLSCMIIPFITLGIMAIIEEEGQEAWQGALDLGVSPMYAAVHLLWPAIGRRCMAPIALGAAFAMGATAPILFVGAALYGPVQPSLQEPFMALPYHLYILVNEGGPLDMAYGTAVVLLVLVGGVTWWSERRYGQ